MNAIKHIGKSSNRLYSDNPREVVFAELWQRENDLHHTLEYLLGDNNRPNPISEEEIEVAATVIQWLGSNVGMSFLRDCINASPEIQRWFKVL